MISAFSKLDIMIVKGYFQNLIWAGAGHYKSISNQMLKLLEGRIRELCTNAANLAAIRL